VSRPSVLVLDDYGALSRAAADLVSDVVAEMPSASVVFATGDTPMGLYGELARRRDVGAFDASSLHAYQLDEYAGMQAADPRSLFGWMTRSLVEPLGIPPEHVVRLPNSDGLDEALSAHDREVAARGGFDLAVLGIGENGHLGFNEPPSDPGAPTREVRLSPQTIRANRRYWGDGMAVPDRAITTGMKTLLASRRILLVASGARKREIVHRALHGPVTPEVPASYLRHADDVTVLLDRDAWGAAGPAA
jgi:glucosamine-6-phosphate deaminase